MWFPNMPSNCSNVLGFRVVDAIVCHERLAVGQGILQKLVGES